MEKTKTKIKIITALAAVAMSINVKGIYGECFEANYNKYLEGVGDNYEENVCQEKLNIEKNINSSIGKIVDVPKENHEWNFINSKLSEYKSNTISPIFTIKNKSLEKLDLSKVKFNYYYKSGDNNLEKFNCRYAGTIDGSYKLLTYNIKGKIVKVNYNNDYLDSYIEIGFNSGILDAGQSMIMQILISKNDGLNTDMPSEYLSDDLPKIVNEYISKGNIFNSSLNDDEELSIGKAMIPEITVKKGDTVTIPINFKFIKAPDDKIDIVNAIIKYDSSILNDVKVIMGDELQYDPLADYTANKNYGRFLREELMAFDQIVESNTGKKGNESGCIYIQLRSEYNKDIYENVAKSKNHAFITFTVNKDTKVNETYLIPFDVKYMTEGIKYHEKYYKQHNFKTHFGKIIIKDVDVNTDSLENNSKKQADTLMYLPYFSGIGSNKRRNPSLSSTGITYFEIPDKDIQINLNLQGTSFKGIEGLTEGIEYELNTAKNRVTLKQSYLSSIYSNKETNLEFKFTNGHTEIFTIQMKSYIHSSKVSIQSKPVKIKKGQTITIPIYTKLNYISTKSKNQNATKETNRAVYTFKYDPHVFENINIKETSLSQNIGGQFWNIVDSDESKIIIGYANTDKDIFTAFKDLPIASISLKIKPDCEEGAYSFQLVNGVVKAGEERYFVEDDMGEVWVGEY